jgi:hypothetical protein
MFDAKELIEKAEAEVKGEIEAEVMDRVKDKLREIKAAEKIVANLRMELQVIVADAAS